MDIKSLTACYLERLWMLQSNLSDMRNINQKKPFHQLWDEVHINVEHHKRMGKLKRKAI